MTKQKTCFVIAPIGEEGSEIRKRAEQVFKHVISPITKALGYDPQMPHHVNQPGSISTQIIDRVLNADLVIADLTGHNANVLYELAVRHMVQKPVVQIIQKGEKLPFDISQQRTIPLDHKDLDSVEDAKKSLTLQIESVQKDPTQVDSPISVAVNLTSLKGSEKPVDTALAEILSQLQDMAREQKNLRRRVEVNTTPVNAFSSYGLMPVSGRPNETLYATHEAIQSILNARLPRQRTDTSKGDDGTEPTQ